MRSLVKFRTILLLVVGLGIVCLPSVGRHIPPAAAQDMLVLDAKDDGRTIHLPGGARFRVDLAVQVGTGFVWLVAGEMPEGLKLISSETLGPGQTGIIGGPGIQRFVLEVMRPGRFTLSLAYRRPWEKRPAAQTFSVIVISR